MADGGAHPTGRIRPADADQVLIAACITVASSRFDEARVDKAMELIRRCLRMVSASTRVQSFLPAAEEIVAAWPHRRKRGAGAVQWCTAHLDLSEAVARDAMRQALARLER
jgi:hypothetical protein